MEHTTLFRVPSWLDSRRKQISSYLTKKKRPPDPKNITIRPLSFSGTASFPLTPRTGSSFYAVWASTALCSHPHRMLVIPACCCR
ncbi:hypothetical protein V496_08649 [Pseudogymnoascus sp. VKM F-4515 (FW-2607)]|nr:hypothetical protein V496_08649 [Pseudogymnoascus sp. VKM F-4515 (FW-2607)]